MMFILSHNYGKVSFVIKAENTAEEIILINLRDSGETFVFDTGSYSIDHQKFIDFKLIRSLSKPVMKEANEVETSA